MHGSDDTLRFPDGSGRNLATFIQDLPEGSTLELAPGRYEGPICIDKAVEIRGAGDLSRISAKGTARVVEVNAQGAEVRLESLSLEDGEADTGAGIRVLGGSVSLQNVHIQRCRAFDGGGAIHLSSGRLDASRLRVNDVSGDRGGAIWMQGDAELDLHDCEIAVSEARQGGAIAVENRARATLEAVTVKKARATTPGGGQALFVSGAPNEVPHLRLRRVRLEDVPFGLPLCMDPEHPGEVDLTACDMPRVVATVAGVVDGGENHWR